MTPTPRDRDPTPPQSAGLYRDMPSVTPRQWGERDATDDSFGQQGLGGYAATPHGNPADQNGISANGQGDVAQAQDRHAQSGRNNNAAQRGGKQARSGGQARPDDSLRDDVIDRLACASGLDAGQILVMVEDGRVTLTGEVPEASMKQRAQDVIEGAQGARDIVNRISVDDGAASFGPPGQAVRSGNDQQGSGFSSSAKIPGRD